MCNIICPECDRKIYQNPDCDCDSYSFIMCSDCDENKRYVEAEI